MEKSNKSKEREIEPIRTYYFFHFIQSFAFLFILIVFENILFIYIVHVMSNELMHSSSLGQKNSWLCFFYFWRADLHFNSMESTYI